MERRLWTREELILALNLYLKLPFGKLHSRTPEIINLATIIGRTAGSVAMRLNNFASVDPFHQQRGIGGLPGGKKQVEPIWNEFIHNKEELLFESEKILADLEKQTIESKFAEILYGTESLKGETKIREVKTRVNQNVLRQIVLSNYRKVSNYSFFRANKEERKRFLSTNVWKYSWIKSAITTTIPSKKRIFTISFRYHFQRIEKV